MRTKRDPDIRREVFITAATELYMEKGYEAVSIRDVLDAVADKTASPSVFYYYFSSKDELYRCCVEALAQSYLASMRMAFSTAGKTTEEWMLSLVEGLEEYLLNERNLIIENETSPNRMFILDMREQVTGQIISLWSSGMEASFLIPETEAQSLARFLAGGIGEMMFHFLQDGSHEQAEVFDFTEKIVYLAVNALGAPEQDKASLMAALKEKHGRASLRK